MKPASTMADTGPGSLHEEWTMTDFRIRFCNDLLNSNGQAFRVCQRELVIEAVAGEDEALEAAKREFERQEGVPSWRLRAHAIECEPLLERV